MNTRVSAFPNLSRRSARQNLIKIRHVWTGLGEEFGATARHHLHFPKSEAVGKPSCALPRTHRAGIALIL